LRSLISIPMASSKFPIHVCLGLAMTRNSKGLATLRVVRHTTAFLLLLAISISASCSRPSLQNGLRLELPQGVVVTRRQEFQFGYDRGVACSVSDPEGSSCRSVVRNWRLEKASTREPISAAANTQIEWWPSESERNQMHDRFYRIDSDREQYWSVWWDKSTGQTFIEWGEW
jgi:hypothetical protein